MNKKQITMMVVVAAAAFLLFFLSLSGLLGYLLVQVDATQIGVRFYQGRITDVVGPGIYSDLRPFASLIRIDTKGIPFEAYDEEVLTKDQQRIGVMVRGEVSRPGLESSAFLIENWDTYKTYYTDDSSLTGLFNKNNEKVKDGLIDGLSKQAMKVAVGDRRWDEAVVGTSRDLLRQSIDDELQKLANNYGLEVRNVVVPNVVLSASVQEQLDKITQERFQEQISVQEKLRIEAEALRDLAKQQGEIKVEQGKIQEKARQDKATAELQEQAELAKKKVISAMKANEFLEAEEDLRISEVLRQEAEQQALANFAAELIKVQTYAANPLYVTYLERLASAQALKLGDKVIFVPPGMDPIMVMGGEQMNFLADVTPDNP